MSVTYKNTSWLSTPCIGFLLIEGDCLLLEWWACSRNHLTLCCGPCRVSAIGIQFRSSDRTGLDKYVLSNIEYENVFVDPKSNTALLFQWPQFFKECFYLEIFPITTCYLTTTKILLLFKGILYSEPLYTLFQCFLWFWQLTLFIPELGHPGYSPWFPGKRSSWSYRWWHWHPSGVHPASGGIQ